MNKLEDDNLLILRLKQRNDLLRGEFQKVFDEMNKRGMLHSSITVKKLHSALEIELTDSANVIVRSLIETAGAKKRMPKLKGEIKTLELVLRSRKQELERMLEGSAHRVTIMNQGMVAPFINLDAHFPLMLEETKTELTKQFDDLQRQHGKTLADRLMYRVKNNPIIAWGIVVVFVVGILVGLYKIVKWVRTGLFP